MFDFPFLFCKIFIKLKNSLFQIQVVELNTAKHVPVLDRLRFAVWKVGNISISSSCRGQAMPDQRETKLNLYNHFFDNTILNRNAISNCRYETCGKKNKFGRNILLPFMRLVQRSNRIWHCNGR